MTYIIIEMQTTNGSTAVVPPATYTDRNQAENKFHTVMAAAAISQVEIHTCLMIADDGTLVRKECYRHQAAQPEPEE